MHLSFKRIILAGLLTFTSLHSYASRIVTDQIGRQVKIPDKIDRVVVLQH